MRIERDLREQLKRLHDQLREVADSHGEEMLERRHDAWGRLLATFRAIHGGVEHEAMRLPAYGGGLFDPDRYPFLEGRRSGTAWREAPAEPVPVNNRTVLHLLEALQFVQVRIPGGPPEARRLSFRALDIEQIGHVYEGLLDHTAVRARGVVLGLVGAAGEEPEVSLDALEAKAAEGEEALVGFLREETGRSVAALRRGLGQPEPPNPMGLQVACGGDAGLYRRVVPFAPLLRDDTQGYPVVILPGSAFVTAGADRRSTGTHYTLRSLTEPVVKTTLDPLLYRGFEQGIEPSPATLRRPEEILALRLCDLACGSSAFLVQACRYMAERLVEAWALAEQAAPGQPLRVPEAARDKRERLERFTALDIRDSEHKARLHREAETATELVQVLGDILVGAGLAIAGGNAASSLAALDRRTEDLAHRVAESLAEPALLMAAEPNLHELRRLADTLLRWSGHPARRPFHWLVRFPEVCLHTDNPGFHAIVGNPPFVGGQKITGLLGTDYRDYQVLHAADGRRGSADLCAYFFLRAAQLLRRGGNFGLLAVNTIAEGDTRQVGLEAMLKEGLAIYAAWPNQPWPGDAAVVTSQVHVHRGPWRAGYRLNGQPVPTISAFLSDQDEWSPKPLKANANRSFQGSIVLGLGFTMREDQARALIERDAKSAEVLFPYLNGEDLNSHPEQKPSRWVINFWDWPLDREAPGTWSDADVDQRERWLREGHVPADYPGRVAEDFPEVLDIVRRRVKPEGDRLKGNPSAEGRKRRWWLYGRDAKALYHAIGRGYAFARHPEGWDPRALPLEQVIVCTLVQNYLKFTRVHNASVFAHRLAVFSLGDAAVMALLSSAVHQEWARKTSSTMRVDINYSPSDSFETFPFPSEYVETLSPLGTSLEELRAHEMRRQGFGLTALYRRLHEPACADAPIAELRGLHREIDEAVLAAYGWTDIPLGRGFHAVPYLPENDRVRYTIAEDARLEVLRRLARLNRERYQEERAEAERQAAATPKRPKRTPAKRGRPRLTVIQGDLF